MKKDKSTMRPTIQAFELNRRGFASGTTEADYGPSSRARYARRGPGLAIAILVAALGAFAASPVLAGKGGNPKVPNVPDVNLGLQRVQEMGVGVGPYRGASTLTPAAGNVPPGHLPTPGLGLGRNGSIGTQPLTPGSGPSGPGLGSSAPLLNNDVPGAPLSSDSTREAGRAASRMNDVDAATVAQEDPPLRRIPVCR